MYGYLWQPIEIWVNSLFLGKGILETNPFWTFVLINLKLCLPLYNF